jgi:hypothetical protein
MRRARFHEVVLGQHVAEASGMRAIATVFVALLTACATDEEPPSYGEGLGTPDDPIPFSDESYDVITIINFPPAGVPVASVVATLEAFAQNPAKTLLANANQADVQRLRSRLPSTLNNQLETWINAEIDKQRVATKTPRQLATDLAAITTSALTKLYLPSTLIMTPAKTTHLLAGLNFRPLTVDIVVPIGGLTGDVIKRNPSLVVGEGGALSLGAHEFGLAYGQHALQGINLASSTLYGGTVQSTLASATSCAALATAVAARCLSGTCVGQASELRAICEAGSVAIAASLSNSVSAVELDVFRFAGSARLVDDNGDGLAERIVEGSWQAELDFGSGVHSVTAAFTAELSTGRSISYE